MLVSMIKLIIEIPGATSLKDKRRIVKSLKDRVARKYKVSIAEVDLLDSLKFAQLGAAKVSNSKKFGETVMQKVLTFVEENIPGRLVDAQILTERY